MRHPSQADPDLELVERCNAGDRVAFRILVEKHQTAVFNTVVGIVKDPDEADDLTQEIFVKVYRSLGRFMGESLFTVWLYRIAVNQSLDRLKSRKRRPSTVSMDDLSGTAELEWDALFADAAPNAAELYEETQLQEAIHRVLRTLAPDHRVVITLKDIEGLSQEEIAAILQCPLGTIKSRLTRAREALKERLRPFYEAWIAGA